jgi:soluble lytic murein transglycosylase-like protein
MKDQKVTRPFKQRLLEGFERTRLRQEVQRARHSKLGVLRNRYTTAVLGASLAVGGVGIPLSQAPKADEGENKADVLSHDLAAARDFGQGTQAGQAEQQAQAQAQAQAEVDINQLRDEVVEEFFRTEVPFGSIIFKEARNNGIAPELVAAVVETESMFKPTARSPVGAQGLMQLMPKTGRWMGATNLNDPADNVKAGTKYLKYLEGRFKGQPTNVLAAYNAGEGNVRKFGGVPPFKETRNYVQKVNKSKRDLAERIDGKVAERMEAELAARR